MRRTAYMLGEGISHSVSPAVHNPVARRLGLDWSYELWDVDAPRLPAAIERIREPDCAGANITMPHKAQAAALADHREPAVERCGAANVLVNHDGVLTAHNTDASAVRELVALRVEALASRPAVILGAGGAAAAALFALRAADIPQIVVLARRPGAAEALAERAQKWVRRPVTGAGFDSLEEHVSACSLLVNATSLGMAKDDPLPLPAELLRPGMLVYDYVYRRGDVTCLAEEAVARGAEVCDGVAHVLAQAEPTFTLLTGTQPPEGALREALVAELGREPLLWTSTSNVGGST